MSLSLYVWAKCQPIFDAIIIIIWDSIWFSLIPDTSKLELIGRDSLFIRPVCVRAVWEIESTFMALLTHYSALFTIGQSINIKQPNRFSRKPVRRPFLCRHRRLACVCVSHSEWVVCLFKCLIDRKFEYTHLFCLFDVYSHNFTSLVIGHGRAYLCIHIEMETIFMARRTVHSLYESKTIEFGCQWSRLFGLYVHVRRYLHKWVLYIYFFHSLFAVNVKSRFPPKLFSLNHSSRRSNKQRKNVLWNYYFSTTKNSQYLCLSRQRQRRAQQLIMGIPDSAWWHCECLCAESGIKMQAEKQ